MVIQQFNRLIKNKWVWGVFAVAISALFAFDFLAPGMAAGGDASKRQFDGEPVDRALYEALEDEARTLLGGPRGRSPRQEDVTNYVWSTMAVLKTAERAGLAVGDDELRKVLEANGFGDPAAYKQFLAASGWGSPARFERYLRHSALRNKYERLAGAAVAVPRDELERRIQDWTSDLAVFEVTFTNGFKDVKADFPAYYASHTNELVLPERRMVRFAFVKADTPERLMAAVKNVDDDDIASYYQKNKDRMFVETRSPTQTVYKSVESVRTQIVERLTAEFAIRDLKEALDRELNEKLYGAVPEKGKPTWLDELAKRENAKVGKSKWISGRDVAGWTASYSEGAKDFPGAQFYRLRQAVTQLPADAQDCEDFPYCNMVDGTNGVYVIEASWVADASMKTPEHLPAAAEAAKIEAFTKMAAEDARENAFRKQMEVREKTLAKELAALPADCTNVAAVSGAMLRPIRRFSVAAELETMEKDFAETAERIRQSNPAYAEQNMQYLRSSMSARLAEAAATAKLPKGGLSEASWAGGNSVRYTFMVERSRNGASENDPARRDMIEKRFAAEIASSAVPGWFKAAVSRGLNPPEAGK